jgi:hypothetical protein
LGPKSGKIKTSILIAAWIGLISCATPSAPPREAPPSSAGNNAAETQPGSDQTVWKQPKPGEQSPRQPEHRQPGYRILKEGHQKNENWLELNEYFLIHHLYTDVFHRFGLHKIISLEDKIRISAALLYNLDLEQPVNLIFDNYKDSAALVVSLQLIQIGRQRSVLLATNADPQGERIYVGAGNVARTFKRSYLIVNDQLIAVADLYSQSRESELIDGNRADKLARFYVFDGNSSNDTVAEGLLIGSIRAAQTALERGRSELILCRYYMSQNRLVEAQALLLDLGSRLAYGEGADELAESYSMTYEQLLITNALKEREEYLQENRLKSL